MECYMAEQVVIFLVDGMRPDGLQQADSPNVDRLIASGRSCMTARTVMPSMTLPCHMSLFHSVEPDRHGITTNTWMPQVRPIPGLIDVLHSAGKHTAAFYNWEELRDLSSPGSLDHAYFSNTSGDLSGQGDQEVAAAAARYFDDRKPEFGFVYLGATDETGHAHGWMSSEYIAAIGNADRCIGQVVDTMLEGGVAIVMADHGGHLKTHGTESDDDMNIPLVISKIGSENLGSIAKVGIIDVAPTVVQLLGVDAPAAWVGSPIEL